MYVASQKLTSMMAGCVRIMALAKAVSKVPTAQTSKPKAWKAVSNALKTSSCNTMRISRMVCENCKCSMLSSGKPAAAGSVSDRARRASTSNSKHIVMATTTSKRLSDMEDPFTHFNAEIEH